MNIAKPYKTVLIYPDLHFRKARNGQPSGEDSQLLRKLVLPFAKEQKPDCVIQLGDFLDLPSLSQHEKYLEMDEAIDYANQDFKYGSEWLEELYAATPNVPWYILEGNHDFRCKSFCTSRRQRHLLSSLDIPKQLDFAAYPDLTWVPYWSDKRRLVRLGKAAFGHGLSAAANHPKVMAAKYPGTNIYYGHVHDAQSFSPATFQTDSLNEARSLGCLCRLDQPYLQGAPTNWCQMISLMYLFKDGTYTLHPIPIIKGKFVFNDRVYSVR